MPDTTERDKEMAKFQSGSVADKANNSTALTTVDEEQAATLVPATPDGDALSQHAMNLGAKASKVMNDTIERIAKAREDWQGGPLYTLLALRSTYEADELDEFAFPGSDTGNNPDKFKVTVHNGDKSTTKQTTFYAQFSRGTASGQAILERLDWLDRAADKGAVKEGIPEDILEMSPQKREHTRSFLNGRLNTMTQAYKKAMQLHFKFKEVNEYADNIKAEPIWEENFSPDDVDNIWEAKIEATQEPIAVWIIPDEGKPVTKWEPMSIGSFLKLNPDKASEKGGGFKALMESGIVKKAPGGGATTEKGGATDELTIKTVDKSLAVVTEFHRYMQEILSAKDGADIGKLYQELGKKGNDEYVTAFVELKNIFNDISRTLKLDLKYTKLLQAGSELVSETKVPAKATA